MNLLFKRSKKIFISILVFALLLSANLGLCVSVANNFKNGVDAVGFENQNSITVSNGSFTSYSNTDSYPYTPSNFTFSESSSSVSHGVININKTTFNSNYDKYGLNKGDYPEKTNKNDNYCLMLNSRKATGDVGYTSKDFTFSKNGSYYVSVEVYTDNVDSSASLYLKSGADVIGEITGINTQKTWQTYYFFITTNDYENMTLNLGLFLGGKSVSTFALFDEINVGEIPNSTIRNFINNSSVDGKTVYTEFGKNYYYKDFSGENVIEELSVNSSNFKDAKDSTFDKKLFDTISLDGEIVDVLKLENYGSAKSVLETKTFDIMANKVYKMSILVKTEDITEGSAFIQAGKVEDGEVTKSSNKLTISSTSNTLYDNFKEYSIIINSDPTKDVSVKFMCGLMADSGETIGKVSFANFKLEVVPYSEFSDINSTTQKTLDLSSDYSSSSQTITNFAFNASKSNSVSKTGVELNEPKDWTINKSSASYAQYAGIFNIKDFDKLDKTGYSSIVNPGFIASINNETNNVLMLHNTKNDVLSATSSSFSLSASSYYVLSVYVQTQNEGNATIQLISNEMLLAEIKNISTNGLWKEYKLYLKTGYNSLSTTLKLSLGTTEQNSRGFAFFDNCMLTTSESAYNASDANKFDVSSPFNLKGDNGEATAFNATTNVTGNVESKIIDLNGDISFDLAHEYRESAKTFEGENKNVLLVKSDDVDNFYSLESKLSYSLSSSSFYKVSVDVYTANMATTQENVTAGASISLSGLTDCTFNGVISDKKWTTYTFYISTDSSVNANFVFGIGNSEGLCTGMAMFGNVVFETIDEDKYTLATANLGETEKAVVEKDETEEEEEEETTKSKKEINWVLLTSTLTAVAVIIAVVGIAIKKVFKPGKKRVKKTKVDYDRNSSVIRQKYRKLAYLKRDRDVRKLEKKVEYLVTDREQKEQKYKDLLKKVREVKLANRDGKLNADLMQLNKELNHSSREVAKSGVTLNKLKSEIAYMKTEGYLLNLEKKLRRQDELAKQKGSSIEEILASEDDIVLDDSDNGLDKALEKADKIIEEEQERERLENAKREAESELEEKAKESAEAVTEEPSVEDNAEEVAETASEEETQGNAEEVSSEDEASKSEQSEQTSEESETISEQTSEENKENSEDNSQTE